ncbi:unnamed protein product [Nippostrongylus brasiliensis]|uniref:Reverse transcriptase domain-containing protein n=1 Tax=Nippostrongylus brasiliensis TaxID=27835 RepID=A0A0N4Y675_NIPBR|nr:unnamed protein product [Nippostrongylus brasiliensis]
MIPSHLTNTRMFLDHLHNVHLHQNCVVESFDVTSLYTNVQNDQALQALSEMLERHIANINTFGLERNSIMTLVKECLNCNIFKWSGTYYSQLRGLAMGQRLAPVLAICFMSRIEEPVLARLPLMYCRYIDDCFIITSTQSEMDECFRILNQQSQHIKLTRETPSDGWLPYLNTQVKNGYMRTSYHRRTTTVERVQPFQDRVPLCLPFISDTFSSTVHRCLVRAQLQNDVVLVNIPNDNIKRQLVRNRLYDTECVSENCVVYPYGKNGDCEKSGVVYEISCRTCNGKYIGETGRVLLTRINEHLASKRRGSITSPLGRHRNEVHDGNDFDIVCRILSYEAEISSRKALEAFWISARNPVMNNRNECLSISNDFLSFTPFCGFRNERCDSVASTEIQSRLPRRQRSDGGSRGTMQTAVFLLLLATAIYRTLGEDDSSKMLEQPVLRARRSDYEDAARNVARRLWLLFYQLKALGANRVEFPYDPFSDVEEEIKMHWDQRRLSETSLKSIMRLLRKELPKLKNTSCLGDDHRLHIFVWCPKVLRKLRDIVFNIYLLHSVVTESNRLGFYIDQLNFDVFENAIRDSTIRTEILGRIKL